jgi:orotidine-5'-phosphate decarboxylase
VPAKLCLALDSRDEREIERWAEVTAEHVDVLKIGLTAFVASGPSLVRRLSALRPVFLDLKLHDIPAQVGGALRAAADTGARFTTVHAFGGAAMLEAAVEAAPPEMMVLAVTVLTSLGSDDVTSLGMSDPADKTVLRLADLARDAGIPGLVCSPHEVAALRERYGPAPSGPVLVVPGIRPQGSEVDDQRRTLGPAEAVAAGADLLVVGRPITGAEDPASAARSLKEQIDG